MKIIESGVLVSVNHALANATLKILAKLNEKFIIYDYYRLIIKSHAKLCKKKKKKNV